MHSSHERSRNKFRSYRRQPDIDNNPNPKTIHLLQQLDISQFLHAIGDDLRTVPAVVYVKQTLTTAIRHLTNPL